MIYLDDKEIVIKYYEAILLLEEHLILIKMNCYQLKLLGHHFMIHYLSHEEIHVRGIMKEVIFIYD